MAVAWTIYTRVEPDLHGAPSTLVWKVEPFHYVPPEPEVDPEQDFVEVDTYTDWNRPWDPFPTEPWVQELRFRVVCAAPDLDRDAAWAFSVSVARTAYGAILDESAQTFTWHGWNLDAMLAHVRDLIEAHQLGELVTYLGLARQVSDRAEPGPFLALAERAVAFLDEIPESTAKNNLLVFLAAARDLPADTRHLLEDAVLAAPPRGKPGKPLRDLQAKLRAARERAWAEAQPLPSSVAEVSALWDRARGDLREVQVLERAFSSEPHRALLVDTILAKARAGEATPGWLRWEWHIGSPAFARTHEFDADHREFFALCGPLAAWLVARWRHDEAYAEVCDAQLDQRRRNGEVHVELPADILSLVRADEILHAIEAYAMRYELSEEQARRVIDAHR